MSASAGRVLIIPRGDYNSAATYNMLDMVYYGGKSYICKQTSTGNVPTNTVYWQIMLDGASALNDLTDVNITDPQNGDGIAYNATTHKWENTTPVGITITSPPATTDYSDGDILDLTGMVVMAEYSTGQTRNITTECTFSPANGSTLTTANTSVSVSWREFTATQAISVSAPIYGVEWDGSSSPAWTRTDLAVGFADPVPYYAGMTDTPSSPFDNISPWKDMQIVEDADAGTLVSIPKFYYKLSQSTPGSGMKIQISMNELDGFHVSPAHMDRGDGVGERDVVYVGRYHCVNSNSKSASGQYPKVNEPRANMRSTIHSRGTDIWQWDFATRFTIWLLYLVEFAHWNSQDKIGYGCGNNSSYSDNGYTDSMPYHTGTTQSSRTTYGLGTQYRNIEGLWDNVFDWLDGGYYDSYGLNIILNPANFDDYSRGTPVEIPTNGNPSQFTIKDINGLFPIFIPTESNGSDSTYSCDYWGFSVSVPCLYVGGSYRQGQVRGMFFTHCNSASNYGTDYGCRLMKLPSA